MHMDSLRHIDIGVRHIRKHMYMLKVALIKFTDCVLASQSRSHWVGAMYVGSRVGTTTPVVSPSRPPPPFPGGVGVLGSGF